MLFFVNFHFYYVKEIYLALGSKSEDGGQTWVTKEHEETDSKDQNSNQEDDIESNQTEIPKKRESSPEKISNSQKNENWLDQLPNNNNFGPDQDYNDHRDKNDAIEIISPIDKDDLDLSKFIGNDFIDIVRKRNQDIINDEEYSHDDLEFVDEVGDPESTTTEDEKIEKNLAEKITEKIEKTKPNSITDQLDKIDVQSPDNSKTEVDNNDAGDKSDVPKSINEKLVQNTTTLDSSKFSPYGIWVSFYNISSVYLRH